MKRAFIRKVIAVLAMTSLLPPANAQTTVAGFTPGSFRVTEGGAAEYRIPIQAPPGIGGIEPRLALVYNSLSGNGLIGMGWQLEGLSAITRCPRTFSQDGVKGGVNFDANDRFCLDGQRLIALSGTYGADAVQYRTERETFSKIVSYGSAGTGPAHFKAWTKAGQVIEYGNTADSRIEAQGKSEARVWALNKLSDTKGNYLTVSYVEVTADGEFYPDRIDYTGNAAASVTPGQSVRFVYEGRPTDDIGVLYQGGSVVKSTQRLKNVQSYLGASTLVKDYRIAYGTGTATKRSRVTSIQECDSTGTGSGTNCVAATSLTWQESGTDLTPPTYSSPALNSTITGGWDTRNSVAHYVRTGDFNGDGRTDYLWMPRDGDGRWVIAYGTATGFTAPDYNTPALPATLDGTLLTRNNVKQYIQTADFNGDGRTDYMWIPDNGDGRWLIAYGTDTGFTIPAYSDIALPATLPDGKTTRSTTAHYIQIGDFNGDGKADYMWVPPNGDGRWMIAYANAAGTGLVTPDYANPALPAAFAGTSIQTRHTTAHYVQVGDFDGDGKTDYMWVPFNGDGRWMIAYANAAGTALSMPDYDVPALPAVISGTSYQTRNTTAQYVQFGDFNGDGKLDYMFIPYNGDGRWLIVFATGTGFTVPDYDSYALPAQLPIGNWDTRHTTAHYLQIGDFNGDGKADYMWVPYDGDGRWLIAYSNGIKLIEPLYSAYGLAATFSGSYITRHTAVQYVKLGDFNGDGKTDYMFVPYNGDGRWVIAYQAGAFPDLVTKVTTGTGVETNITHKPLTDSAVYAKETGATYPVLEFHGPLHAVSSYTVGNGIGGTMQTSHSYKGARIDLRGRGFLGFRETTATSVMTGYADPLKTITTYRQDFPFTGLPCKVERQVAATSPITIGLTENTFAAKSADGTGSFSAVTLPGSWGPCTQWLTATQSGSANRRFFPYVDTADETAFELNGAFVNRAKTVNQFNDDYGNATSIAVTTFNSGGTATDYSKATTNTYANDATNWFLGRLTQSTVTSTTP